MAPFFLILFLFVYCGGQNFGIKPVVAGKPVAEIMLYNSKVDYPIEKIAFSEFVDSVRFIKFETTEMCQNINSVLFINQEIIVLDKVRNNILVFDNDRKFIRKIAKRGQKAGEYMNIASCNYDSEGKTLIIYDNIGTKLLLYRTTGEFIKEVSIKKTKGKEIVNIGAIINLPNGNYLCYNNALYKDLGNYSGLWEIDKDGNFVRTLLKYDVAVPAIFTLNNPTFQSLTDGTIAIRDAMHHDIYHYNAGEINKYISYEIKDSKLIKHQGTPLLNQPILSCIGFHESNNYIITHWKDETGVFIFGLYNKSLNKVRFTNTFESSDLNVIWPLERINSNRDNMIFVSLSGTKIMQILKENTVSEQTRNILSGFIKNMNEDEIKNMMPIIEVLFLKNKSVN